MNDQMKKRITFRNALCWASAIMLPAVVMVVLDLFDKHTPRNIVTFTGIMMVPLAILSNTLLGKGLANAAETESDP